MWEASSWNLVVASQLAPETPSLSCLPMTRCNAFCYVLAALFLCVSFVQGSEGSTNNWAVLVNTSRCAFLAGA